MCKCKRSLINEMLIALTEYCANLLRACIKLSLKIKSGDKYNITTTTTVRSICVSAECFIVFVV